MLKRFLSALVGGVIGIAGAWGFQDSLGSSPSLAYVACTLGGIGVGYVASMLFDVFAGTASGPPSE